MPSRSRSTVTGAVRPAISRVPSSCGRLARSLLRAKNPPAMPAIRTTTRAMRMIWRKRRTLRACYNDRKRRIDRRSARSYRCAMINAMNVISINERLAPSEVDGLWEAVLARDARSDGRFVYAVQSTGIYCRPSCPSRRPKRESVRFFPGPDSAELAGFRECRRCHPRAGAPPAPGIDHVRKATAFIASHADEAVTLATLASHVGTSPFHLQR